MKIKGVIYVLGMVLVFMGCQKSALDVEPTIPETTNEFWKTPPGFEPMPIPSDNELTEAKVKLGEKLFFDKRLSSDNSISCGSCHKPHLAFTDGKSVSTGVQGRKGKRSSPSLVNLAWGKQFMWDGGPRSLEAQVLLPFQNEDEMDLNILEAVEKIEIDPDYIELFNKAFDSKPGAIELTQAIASFERSLISAHSRVDEFLYQNNSQALNSQEKRGYELFTSRRLACSSCHTPPLFTNHEFFNNGLEFNPEDPGRYRITMHTPDKGKFKVPTLRNIALTGPYMHNGRFSSLEEVIEHYNTGGSGYQTQDSRIKPLNLTTTEKADLLAFLRALTDQKALD